MKFRWEDILGPTLKDFLEYYKVAYNCPIGLAVCALLAMTSSVCGPKTRTQVVNYTMPLNTFSLCVCAPGGGKSVAFEKIVCEPCESILKEFGVSILLEAYSSAGLHRHHIDNRNYALVSSDEGHRIIANISSKEGRNEGERALINKLWNGKGDKTALRDSDRGFNETSFSLAIFIQPQPIINEMLAMGIECDGFYDRFVFFVEKPRIHVGAEQRAALTNMEREFGENFLIEVFNNMFEIHENVSLTYVFSDEANAHYDSLLEEHAFDFNSQYQSDTGKQSIWLLWNGKAIKRSRYA